MESLAVVFILQVFRISVPYLFASVGAVFSERGGVINLALEGLILAGAFGAMLGQHLSGSAWTGVAVALALGLIVSLLHAFVTITLRADQIVSGIAINILVMGATRFSLGLLFGSAMNSPRIAGMEASMPLLDPLLIIAVLSVALGQFMLFRTPYGLRLRAAGESAEAVETAGLDVRKLRYSGVLISGALAALGGAFLVFQQHSFTDNMSAGRGYIALAAMIIGKWSPAGAALASVLFASAEAMSMWFPSGWLPTQLVQSLPYLITLLVLAGFVGKATPPKEVGVPYEPE
ncbi:inner-membrane translocator [Chlorobaculum parvum NCIB 8327]|uniref:Inner-membrane translocator n=1 Tax=Chlorobaculum parvum (strain DSM 263 / NCIMB 8327) TaxID=517417 RepID=B3QLP0_CHLP8|nr:ABC transporter permease [Chlorobaculum parvum]ACF10930.1 inner-membrane translocator [Chlorobaculum parvum NCIB 8327]